MDLWINLRIVGLMFVETFGLNVLVLVAIARLGVTVTRHDFDAGHVY